MRVFVVKCLYIDDLRPLPQKYTDLARTFESALNLIISQDWDRISFDHDLGSEIPTETGLTLLNKLEELVFLGFRKAPFVEIHTDNGGARKLMMLAANKINSMIDIDIEK